ncbi:MAG TPA: type II toxin-antitoxin system HicB family antitoxin [Methanothrix sp.]|nr:type II toxin-antitoxin system HicB family antitoxin [Methanothrix sp.]
MFSEYVRVALGRARYETLENGSYMATVDGLPGVIATGDNIEKCREDLIEVIEEWIAIRLQRGLAIPDIDGHSIYISQEQMAVV